MKEGKIMINCELEYTAVGSKTPITEIVMIELPDLTDLTEEEVIGLIAERAIAEQDMKYKWLPLYTIVGPIRCIGVRDAVLFPNKQASWYEELDWPTLWKQILREARLNTLTRGV